jgi:hypothetical protein
VGNAMDEYRRKVISRNSLVGKYSLKTPEELFGQTINFKILKQDQGIDLKRNEYAESNGLKYPLEEPPKDFIEKFYTLILRKKKKIPKDEHKSIWEYVRTWPEKIKERAGPILKSAPKPPLGPVNQPEFKR